VVKDQTLATLDPLDYHLAAEEAEANLAKAQARQRNANANYERVRRLYETRTASRSDLDNARAEFEAATAQVAAFQKARALALRQLEYTLLRAPTDGAIGEKIAEVNENVRPNQPVLMMVSGTQPEVEVQIPESLIGLIDRGEQVDVAFAALDEDFMGEVIYIGVATTGTSTTYPVTLRIDDPDHKIRSGMTAEVTFTLPYEEGSQLVMVPSIAVGGDLEGPYVYVVNDKSVIERRSVVPGELIGDQMEIVSGLQGGETVVVAGLDYLQPGSKVTLYRGKPYGDK
jgi:RND family efflux transporter MFP subunit